MGEPIKRRRLARGIRDPHFDFARMSRLSRVEAQGNRLEHRIRDAGTDHFERAFPLSRHWVKACDARVTLAGVPAKLPQKEGNIDFGNFQGNDF